MYRIWFGNDIGKFRIFIWKIYIVLSTTCTKLIVCFLISTVLSADGMVGEKVMRGGSKVKSGRYPRPVLGLHMVLHIRVSTITWFSSLSVYRHREKNHQLFSKSQKLKKNYYSRIIMNSRFFYYSGLIEF